jgi:hypothetical protein
MIGLLIMFIVFAAFAALSVRFGVDSRIESNDPRRSDYPVGIS